MSLGRPIIPQNYSLPLALGLTLGLAAIACVIPSMAKRSRSRGKGKGNRKEHTTSSKKTANATQSVNKGSTGNCDTIVSETFHMEPRKSEVNVVSDSMYMTSVTCGHKTTRMSVSSTLGQACGNFPFLTSQILWSAPRRRMGRNLDPEEEQMSVFMAIRGVATSTNLTNVQ